jgi:hypothetical protein
MFNMIECGIRGGMSVITHRLATANNKNLSSKLYDDTMPASYCVYLDANNLYGWAMSQSMPYSNLHWLSEEEISRLDVLAIADDSEEGFILEVDLHYPSDLHDLHNDLPLAPERRRVCPSEWSPMQKRIYQHSSVNRSKAFVHNMMRMTSKGPTTSAKTQKLIADLYDKNNYVIHYRNLKLYLRLGMILRKIHRVIAFKQSPWLSKYISLNTDCRKRATNTFEKDFFKLMNNSVFGKTMENVRNRQTFELVSSRQRLAKVVGKPCFRAVTILNEDLVLAKSQQSCIKLFKPIFIGFSILDISKELMYAFHYDVIKARYGNAACLCFTDTDSLLYHIRTRDIYSDMAEQKDFYDFSDYPTDHKLFSADNKKVLGKMKDEMNGQPIAEFVGLRCKMYSVLQDCGKEKKVAKGVQKATIKKSMTHEMYRHCLLSHNNVNAKVRNIRSFNHEVFSIVQSRTALSCFDDKRYILDDGVHTRAYGHFRNSSSSNSSSSSSDPSRHSSGSIKVEDDDDDYNDDDDNEDDDDDDNENSHCSDDDNYDDDYDYDY